MNKKYVRVLDNDSGSKISYFNYARILDMCCGSKMFYFNKENPNVIFLDCRAEKHILCDGRKLAIEPDIIGDFRDLPFLDNRFDMVVFDPPHLLRVGEKSWVRKKYGALNRETWAADIKKGFQEAFRCLRPNGTLLFKWNECQIPTSKIIALAGIDPLIVQRVGKNDKTHWIVFFKGADYQKAAADTLI